MEINSTLFLLNSIFISLDTLYYSKKREEEKVFFFLPPFKPQLRKRSPKKKGKNRKRSPK